MRLNRHTMQSVRRIWRKKGYRVLRFWNHEVRENMAGVYQTILSALAATPRTPTQPSPLQGEGFTDSPPCSSTDSPPWKGGLGEGRPPPRRPTCAAAS